VKISVCMATYNGDQYIGMQLKTILNQLNSCDEIIVSDDGSTDNTLYEIAMMNDPRIKVYKHNRLDCGKAGANKNHYYVTNNYENAIRHANGDLIFLADQDDLWREDKVDELKKELKKNILVVTNCSIIDRYNNEIQREYFIKYRKRNILFTVLHCPLHGCCIAFRRDLVKRILPFPVGVPTHDLWIELVARFFGNVLYDDRTFVSYRIHDNNVSKGHKAVNSIVYKINYRLRVILELAKRVLTNKTKGNVYNESY
jgi:glycosyltransferase involved in cell wall biosynthesis